MSNWTYALLLCAIATTLLGPWVYAKARFWQRWRNMLYGLGAVSAPFVLWDIVAVEQRHWSFSEHYTQPLRILGLPLEEILFFVVVPLACMFVWTFIESKPNKRIINDQRAKNIVINAALAMAAVGIFIPSIYTRIVLLVAAVACFLLSRYPGLITGRRFWVFQATVLGLFLICNTILTSLPIISYHPDAIIGLRLGTIPIEDVFYNFALITLFLICFMRGERSLK